MKPLSPGFKVGAAGAALAAGALAVRLLVPGYQVSLYGNVVLLTGLFLCLLGLALAVSQYLARQPSHNRALPILLSLIGLALGLLLLELGARLLEASAFYTGEMAALRSNLSDAELGRRMRPSLQGHDRWGFRNESVPQRADIVAIGDSQTWGGSATRANAWPQALGRLSGAKVYNMALGSYGAVQYWRLMEKALTLSPRVIVTGLYFGNDFWDAYHLVYGSDVYARFRQRAYGEIAQDTIVPRLAQVIEGSHRARHPNPWQYLLTNFGVNHTALMRLAIYTSQLRSPPPPQAGSQAPVQLIPVPPFDFLYRHDTLQTLLTPAYRLCGQDLGEPRIRAGLDITRKMLRQIKARLAQAQVNWLLLLIPTKEKVFAPALTATMELPPAYRQQQEMENRLRGHILQLCRSEKLNCLEVAPALTRAVQQRQAIYPYSDSHFNALGYRLIAEAVKTELEAREWLP